MLAISRGSPKNVARQEGEKEGGRDRGAEVREKEGRGGGGGRILEA